MERFANYLSFPARISILLVILACELLWVAAPWIVGGGK